MGEDCHPKLTRPRAGWASIPMAAFSRQDADDRHDFGAAGHARCHHRHCRAGRGGGDDAGTADRPRHADLERVISARNHPLSSPPEVGETQRLGFGEAKPLVFARGGYATGPVVVAPPLPIKSLPSDLIRGGGWRLVPLPESDDRVPGDIAEAGWRRVSAASCGCCRGCR
jgi:hypothetical protein